MPALLAGIHVFLGSRFRRSKAWMAGTGPDRE
jgi:hypothetical protein